jgi:glycosyltransferase involved in cell wall biosynthesis
MGSSTSVIMPVRNGAVYIAEAAVSVLAQIDQDDELIIIDDHSSDDTLSIVAAIADLRLRMLSSSRSGVSAARNIGLSVARGEFIAFLDHDDFWPADRHAVMLRVLRENSDLDAVFGRVRVQFEPGITPSVQYLEMDGAFLQKSLVGSGLYRRRILDQIGGFAEDMCFAEDVDYSIRLIEAGLRSELCDIECLVYRRHGSNVTNDQQGIREGLYKMIRRKLARAQRHTITAT